MERSVSSQTRLQTEAVNPLSAVWLCVPGDYLPTYIATGPELANQLFSKPVDRVNTVYNMNVAEVVDPEGKSPTAKYIRKKYLPRGTALATRTGEVVVAKDAPAEFLVYQNRLRGYELVSLPIDFESEDFVGVLHDLGERISGKVIRPYMAHSKLLREVSDAGAAVAGWSRTSIGVLERLNNKFKIVNWLRYETTKDKLTELGMTENHTNAAPTAIEIEKSQLLEGAKFRLDEISRLYDRHELNIKKVYEQNGVEYKKHKPKIIIRPSWGGGSYETFSVQENLTEDGDKTYSIGFEGREVNCKTWELARKEIESHLSANGNSDKYTITRYIQKVDDPGINVVILSSGPADDKRFYVAPVHGQVSKGTMCLGTTSENYLPERKKDMYYFDGTKADNIENRKAHLESARRMAAFVANKLANESHGDSIIGVDVMVSGFFEYALAESVKGTLDQNEAVGSLVVAEVNARPTQRTMHHLTQLSIKRAVEGDSDRPLTYGDVIYWYEQIANGEMHFTSNDSFPVTASGWRQLMAMAEENMDNVSEGNILAGINGTDEGVYIIMPQVDDSGTMGIGIMAKTKDRLHALEDQLTAVANGLNLDNTM